MKRALRILGVIIIVVIVLVVGVPFLIPVNQFRPTIEQKASAALGRQVSVGELHLSLISGSLAADNLSIADDPKFNKGPFLSAKSIKVGVELMPLILSKELNITGITIDNPEVTLIRDQAGEWNYSTFGTSGAKSQASREPVGTHGQPKGGSRSEQAKTEGQSASQENAEENKSSSGAGELSVAKLSLNNGRIIVGSTNSRKRSTYDKVDLTASDVSLTTKFPVTLTASLPGGGTLKLQGNVGPFDESNAAVTPVDAKLSINSLNLASTGFLDSSSGLGGLLDVDASLASKNEEAQLSGTAKLSKALLVQGGSPASIPATIDFRTKYGLRKNAGVLEPSQLKIGSAVAHLSGTYQVPAEGMDLHVKVEAQNMPAKDLEAFLPAVGVNLPAGATLEGGALNANLNLEGPTNKLVTAGNVGLFSAKLVNFDIGSKLASIGNFVGIKTPKDLDIEKLTADARVAPDGLQVQNLNLVAPAVGTLAGNGTIDARNQLDFKMALTLRGGTTTTAANAPQNEPGNGSGNENPGGGLGGLLARVTGGTNSPLGNLGGAAGGILRGCKGTGGPAIPFQVKGTTKDPKFVPDVGGIAAGVLKSQLGCAGGGLLPKGQQQGQQQPGQQQNPNAIKGLLKSKPF
jgi:AsmA protein